MLLVEEARLRFNTYTRLKEEPSPKEWQSARRNLLAFVEDFLHSREIDPEVYDRVFRVFPISTPQGRDLSPFLRNFTEKKRVTVADALIACRSLISNSSDVIPTKQESLNFQRLDSIVPRQQVAPA
jgi:hypothetical protein